MSTTQLEKRTDGIQHVDIVLVNPADRKQIYSGLSSWFSAIEPPLWIALTAAFVRDHGYSVKIIDAEAENWDPTYTARKVAEYDPILVDVFALGPTPSSSSTPKMSAAGKVLTELKRTAPHVKAILSGIHPSSLPERTIGEEDVDFVCQGEGFYTILQLLDALKSSRETRDYKINGLWYLKNGKVVANPRAPVIKNLDELPFAAWDLLPMDRYRAHNWHCFGHIHQRSPYGAIYTSLGCPFNCSYCNIHALYSGKPGIRYRSPEKVVAEINFLVKKYKMKNLKIIDELFTLREERVIRICDLIISGGYDLNIWAYGRVDTVSERMLRKMKQAGINWIAFGFESASERVRKGVNKRIKEDATRRAIEMTRAAGMYIQANFMFGLPDDDFESMQQTLDMVKEYNFEYVNFYTTMAYPGSQLYEDAVRQGIELPKKWHGYGQYSDEALPMPTRYLSGTDVLRFRDNAFNEYFSNPKYIQMVQEKFGQESVESIHNMLRIKLKRKYA